MPYPISMFLLSMVIGNRKFDLVGTLVSTLLNNRRVQTRNYLKTVILTQE